MKLIAFFTRAFTLTCLAAHGAGATVFVVQENDHNREWHACWLSVAQGYGKARSFYIQERRPVTCSIFTEDANQRSR